MGLREEKKRKTRKSISDLATRLFIDRGYNEVTTAEIARLAGVSVPTLFNYFPTKESLVFDDDAEVESALVQAVKRRKKGQPILDALLHMGLAHIDDIPASDRKNARAFLDLIEQTPELNRSAKQMWLRHEKSLGEAIRKGAKRKISSIEAEAIARYVLDSFHRALATPNPKAALRTLFALLQRGCAD